MKIQSGRFPRRGDFFPPNFAGDGGRGLVDGGYPAVGPRGLMYQVLVSALGGESAGVCGGRGGVAVINKCPWLVASRC